MSQYDTFDRILTLLHEALLDDAHWPATSALIDEACGMTGNELVVAEGFGSDVRILSARFYCRGERRQDLERTYFEVYHPWDERLPRLRRLPDCRVAHVTELYTGEELKTSATYNEWMPHSGTQSGLNVRLDGPNDSRIIWVLANPVEAGGWHTAQLEMIHRLLPHIRQFVQVRRVVAGAEALGGSLGALLDNTRVGVIHLDWRGRIIEANDRARAILRQGDGLFDEDGFLHARWPADNARLETLLRQALPTFRGQAASGSTTIRRPPGLPRLAVHLSPVPARQLDFGLRPVAALVLVVDPGSQPRIDSDLVASALGLTPSESQVATLLTEGKTVRDIAEATHRQANTVYWLLKQVYDKHGISRQAELVRLVLSLSELSGPGR